MAQFSSEKAKRLFGRGIARASALCCLLLLSSCASIYFRPTTPPGEPHHISELGALPFKEIWSGFVFNGEKVGFTHLKIEPLDKGTLFCITSEAYMHIRFLGVQKKVDIRSRDIVRPDLTLVSFHYEQRMDEKVLVLDGELVDGSLKTVQGGGDKTKTFDEHVEGPLYPSSIINLYPVLHGLSIGANYSYRVFDPQVQAVAEVTQSVASFEQSTKLLLEPSFKVQTRLHGHQVSSWINLRGETIFETAMGGTLITYKEKEESARRYLTEASLNKKDLLLDFSLIRTATSIPCPRDATYMELALAGMPEDLPLLQGPGQHVNKREINGKRVAVYEVRSGLEGYETAGDAYIDRRERLKYLTSSYHIESQHPEIKRTAKKVVAGANTPLEKVRALVRWVSDAVEDEVEESVSALEVLHHRKGECQAHTLLYTALARASGIPTRLVGGLVYAEDMGFLYHAWAESYVDGWVAVDPTFNQVGVDATHIKLVEGGSWISLLQIGHVIGKIEADVIRFSVTCQNISSQSTHVTISSRSALSLSKRFTGASVSGYPRAVPITTCLLSGI